MSTNISSLGARCVWEIFFQKLVILLKNQPPITISGRRKIIGGLLAGVVAGFLTSVADSMRIGIVQYSKYE